MSSETLGLIGVVVLLILLATRMWNAAAMALVGFFGLICLKGWDQAFSLAGQAPYVFIGNYDISVIPMFVLMGVVVSETGIGADLYYTVNKWLGQFRGGLAMATTGACALFAAVTGASISGIVVMSKVALPEMKKYDYDDRLSTGVIAAASTLGCLIPPSTTFILYGILTEQSVGKLFMAGLIPGVLEAAFYLATIYIMCRINPQMGPPGPKTDFKEKIVSLKNTWSVLLLFLLVMGGIYLGVFTPTEAGAIGAFGAIVITLLMRRLNMNRFRSTILEAGLMTGMILLILLGVTLFQRFMAASELPMALGAFITGLDVPPMVVLVSIVIVYVILGCFLPAILAIILTIPIIYPLIIAMGFDPIWYGVLMVRMTEIGALTPPMGIDCFMLSGVSGIPLGTIFRGVVPFVIADVLHVALLIAVPQLSLFLPNMMM